MMTDGKRLHELMDIGHTLDYPSAYLVDGILHDGRQASHAVVQESMACTAGAALVLGLTWGDDARGELCHRFPFLDRCVPWSMVAYEWQSDWYKTQTAITIEDEHAISAHLWVSHYTVWDCLRDVDRPTERHPIPIMRMMRYVQTIERWNKENVQ